MLRVVRFTTVLALFVSSVPMAGGADAARPGSISVVEVSVPDRAALDALVAGGYDIDSVRGDAAIIYATAAELQRLSAAGFRFVEIGRQPAPPVFTPGAKGLGVYHDYAALTTELETYAAAYPDICRLESIGQSSQGRELWVLLITDNPDIEEDEPEFKYVSTMHGDEPLGAELCLYLIDRLLTDYGTDARITDLVDDTAIWIMPLMNPDGLELGWRYDSGGYDLNRSFPTFPEEIPGTLFDGAPLAAEGRPVEVARVMEWTVANRFVLSANLHTGSLLVNYPYDDDDKGSVDSPTPDDLLFEEISRRYSIHNQPMWESAFFADGISNGAAWYSISGGMQDWNYRYVGCNEVTIELSDVKKPAESSLPDFWAENEESMLSYMESVHIGVRGRVTDAFTGEPVYAKVMVEGNAQPVFTDPDVGDYHRMLLPGIYTLTFSAPGYPSETVTDIVVEDGPAVRVDVMLQSAEAMPAAHWVFVVLVVLVLLMLGLRLAYGL